VLQSALQIAKEASRIVLQYYRDSALEVQLKQDCSPLTIADMKSHEFITRELTRSFAYPVVSEEDPIDYQQRREWNHFWLVDPLDGTKDFIAATDEFTINIALIEGDAPQLGVVAVPALGLFYYAAKGAGAFKDTAAGTEAIYNRREGAQLICAESRFHASEKTKDFCQRFNITRMLHFGSAMKLCKIAEGEVDVYPRFNPTMEWDTAAGHCILNEAGGKVVDMITKNELVYNKESMLNNPFMASSRRLNFL
jgi:3'(2'), 5'-bisphosphate nucleotidase